MMAFISTLYLLCASLIDLLAEIAGLAWKSINRALLPNFGPFDNFDLK